MNIGSVLAGAGKPALPAVAPTLTGGARSAGAVARAAISPAGASTVGAAVESLLRGLTPTSAQRYGEQLGDLLSRLVRGTGSGTLTGAVAATVKLSSPSSSKAASTSGALGFLADGRLSVEEKLARLMVYLSDKYEKQLEQKLQQYADLESGKGTPKATTKSTGASGTSSKGSSPLGALGDGLSKLVSKAGLGSLLTGTLIPQLATQVAAPVLAGAATALGMPALAPVLLKAGPVLGSVASGALSALTGSGSAAKSTKSTGSTGSTSATKSTSSGGAATDAPSEKQLMTEIQILQEKQKEMFALVSNILRSMHDTKMAVIGNIR